MKQSIQRFVTKKLSNLRVCLLLVLCFTASAMLMGGTNQPPSPAEAADAATGALQGLTVAVDPGHGGYDGGARAHDSGVWEKELTLQIAQAIEKELSLRGASVVLTRQEDVCLADGDGAGKTRKRADLQKRLDIASEAGADVFLSIHLNEYRSRSESGPQVFYQRGADAGRLLAGALQEQMIAVLKPQKVRKAMAGDYYVLRGELPSALVECGFLSHPEEEKLLLDPSYHLRIAQAVANGLESWLELRPPQEKNGD